MKTQLYILIFCSFSPANVTHLNGHLDFSNGFQVIDPSNYEKVLKSRKKPGH